VAKTTTWMSLTFSAGVERMGLLEEANKK